MGLDSVWHWLVLLVIALLVFGTKKVRHLGPDLGAAIRDFKKSLASDDEAKRNNVEPLRTSPPTTSEPGSSTAQQHDSRET